MPKVQKVKRILSEKDLHGSIFMANEVMQLKDLQLCSILQIHGILLHGLHAIMDLCHQHQCTGLKTEKMTFMKKGTKLLLRYRVLVHAGDHLEAKIAEEFEKYKSEK